MASKTNHSIILKKSKNLISFSSKDSAIRSSDSRSKSFEEKDIKFLGFFKVIEWLVLGAIFFP